MSPKQDLTKIKAQQPTAIPSTAPSSQGKSLKEKPHYSFFAALYRSFYSQALYRDVNKRWKGFGFLYLLLVVFIFETPQALYQSLRVTKEINDEIITTISQIPPFELRQGKVIFNQPMPYFVNDAQGKTRIIIDTTGKFQRLEQVDPQVRHLITKTYALTRLPPLISLSAFFPQEENPSSKTANTSANEKEEIIKTSFAQSPDEKINGKSLVASLSLKKQLWWIALSFLLMLPLAIMGFYVPVFLAAALFGQFFAKTIYKISLSYKTTLRLLCVSATPHLIALLLFLFFNNLIKIPAPFTSYFIYFLLLVLYFNYALLSIRKDKMSVLRTG